MADLINCVTKDLTMEQLISMLVTKTTGGEFALRTMVVEACALDAIDCVNHGAYTPEIIFQKLIGVSACGKPALRLGATPEAMANALGIPSYADLTAANTALAAGEIYYDIAIGKPRITTA